MYSFHGLTGNVETDLYFSCEWQIQKSHCIICIIGKAALYDNTSPTLEIFSPNISVKIVNVMCCLDLLFLQLRNYSK